MVETQVVIKNSAGIHCRPSAEIVKVADALDATIKVQAASGSCVIGSVMELLMLGLEQGTPITLQVEGANEEAVAAQFKELFETEFDFPNAGQG
ncbi:MAG: HPr family phosphocarrier protein [Kiritimatiellaceae bacterium]|nr:HPr family phosphocarrier protein [Kiritimatiellaceae bacterium]